MRQISTALTSNRKPDQQKKYSTSIEFAKYTPEVPEIDSNNDSQKDNIQIKQSLFANRANSISSKTKDNQTSESEIKSHNLASSRGLVINTKNPFKVNSKEQDLKEKMKTDRIDSPFLKPKDLTTNSEIVKTNSVDNDSIQDHDEFSEFSINPFKKGVRFN